MNDLLQFFIIELYERVDKDKNKTGIRLYKYLEDRVEPVFARRKGIQNWSDRQREVGYAVSTNHAMSWSRLPEAYVIRKLRSVAY